MSPTHRLARARALNTGGIILSHQQNNDRAYPYFEEAMSLLENLGLAGQHTLAVTRMGLGIMITDWAQAVAQEKESLAVFREEGDIFDAAECLQYLSILAINREEHELAIDREEREEGNVYLLENLALRKQINDLDGMGWALRNLGYIAFIQGRPVEAGIYFNDSLELFHKVGNKRYECNVLLSQSSLDLAAGHLEQASQKCQQMLRIGTEQSDNSILADGLFRQGRIAWNQADYPLAKSCYEQALAIARETGSKQQLARAHLGQGGCGAF